METMRRTRVKIVAVAEEPNTPCWPCIDHDVDKVLRRTLKPIIELNPDMDFDTVVYTQMHQAEADYENDLKLYDGVLVLVMTCLKDVDKFYAAQAKEGIPTIIADVPYCGSGSVLPKTVPFIRENKLPVPVLSTLNDAELAEAVKLFDVIAKMKQTVILSVSNSRRRTLSAELFNEWGCRFEVRDCKEFIEYMSRVSEEEATAIADRWIAEADEVREASRDDILESARVHLALRDMMRDVGAHAVTVDCLSLSYAGEYGENRHFYPCLSHFEMLNNGIVAVCESDLCATVSSLIAYYMTGKQGFVSDPVIDTASNQIIYAHCVGSKKAYGVGDTRTCRYAIRSHAEDKRGASVQIIFPLGDPITTLMVYPSERFPATVHTGRAVGNVGLQEACRSKLAAETNAERILEKWTGYWHRVTVYGDYRRQFLRLCKMKGLDVVEEDR